jgi:hypothetical protein
MEGWYAHTVIIYFFDDYYGSGPQAYEITINKFRLLPRFMFHIGKNPKLDPYIAVGIGYFSRSLAFSLSNPAYNYPSPVNGNLYPANWPFEEHITPVTLTSKFGFRYFFLDNRIGIGAEVGFGGPALAFGITVKFR